MAATVIALDRTKPYGHIVGTVDGFESARYFQDGRYFDPQGTLLGSDAPIVVAPIVPPLTKRVRHPASDPLMDLLDDG